MSWQDRLQPVIILFSPKGNSFSAKWRGNTMAAKKHIGEFNYPLAVGTVVQDLGLSSFTLPITLYFDGPSCDLDSGDFITACAESGLWAIYHPIRGKLHLQLSSVTVHDEPVESGNIIAIDTEWINPSALKLQASSSEYAADAAQQNAEANAASMNAFGALSSAIDAVASAYGSVMACANAINAALNTVTGAFFAAYSQLQAASNALSTDLLSTAGLLQNLVQTPGLIAGDIGSQIQVYRNVGKAVLAIAPNANNSPGFPTQDTVSQAQGAELGLAAITGAICLAVTNTPPTTRPDAIAAINQILQWWSDLTTALDASTQLFQGFTFANSYLALIDAYPFLQQLLTTTILYLLSIIFDLKSQITFTLPVERATIQVAIDCYGQNGWDDSMLDLFIASNKLYGDQINLLPAGFQVSYYPGAQSA